MAWGLEARVPFLDKKFLEVAMNIDPNEKAFTKGAEQETDEGGCPKMEKVFVTSQSMKNHFYLWVVFLVHLEKSL